MSQVEMGGTHGVIGRGVEMLCRKSDRMSLPDSLSMDWRLILI